MNRIKIINGLPVIEKHHILPFSKPSASGFELRSFTIHDEKIYFVSSIATKKIFVTENSDNFKLLYSIDVPGEFVDMEEIHFFSDGKVAISSWPSSFAIIDNINSIVKIKNEYARYPFKGSPYWITGSEDNLFIPEIGSSNGIGIWSYKNGNLKKKGDATAFTSPSASDVKRKSEINFQLN